MSCLLLHYHDTDFLFYGNEIKNKILKLNKLNIKSLEFFLIDTTKNNDGRVPKRVM